MRRRVVNNHSWHPWLSELLGEETTMELIKQAHAVTQEEMADMGAEPPKAKGAASGN